MMPELTLGYPMPIGSRAGCSIFEAFSTALQDIEEHKNCVPMFHILDIFLMVSQMDEEADKQLLDFMEICGILGVSMVVKKPLKRGYA